MIDNPNKRFNEIPPGRLSVVVRSSSERTLETSEKLVEMQLTREHTTHRVEEFPFSSSLRKTLEIGLGEGSEWLAVIDADILLRAQSIEKMLLVADSLGDHFFEVHGYILDKLIGGVRAGGLRLYRTAHIEKALSMLPPPPYEKRPETWLMQRMQSEGYPHWSAREITGLHDFEQSFRDYFRKGFTHARKHGSISTLLLEFWDSSQIEDWDYSVALKGFRSGLENQSEFSFSSNLDVVDKSFSEARISFEKPPLDSSEWDHDRVEKTIEHWREPPDFHKYFPCMTSTNDTGLRYLQRYFDAQVGRFGLLKAIALTGQKSIQLKLRI